MEFIGNNFWKGNVRLIGATHIIFNNGYNYQTSNLTLVDRHLYDTNGDCGEYEDTTTISVVEELMLNVC